MYYYKSQGTVFSQDSEINNEAFEKITEEEYKSIIVELQSAVLESTEDEQTVELEQENA